MKKIILSAIISLALFTAHAQNSDVSKGPNISKEDPHNPLVNGIPYTQYKAQQDVLKQQKLANVQKQTAAHANMKAIMEKQAAQAKANKGKASTLDVYNKKHKEEFLKQKAEIKAQKGTKTAVTH